MTDTATRTIDADLARMADLLHDAYERDDIEVVCGCWVRIDRLLDKRLAVRALT
jgi:hypothetical protein